MPLRTCYHLSLCLFTRATFSPSYLSRAYQAARYRTTGGDCSFAGGFAFCATAVILPATFRCTAHCASSRLPHTRRACLILHRVRIPPAAPLPQRRRTTCHHTLQWYGSSGCHAAGHGLLPAHTPPPTPPTACTTPCYYRTTPAFNHAALTPLLHTVRTPRAAFSCTPTLRLYGAYTPHAYHYLPHGNGRSPPPAPDLPCCAAPLYHISTWRRRPPLPTALPRSRTLGCW